MSKVDRSLPMREAEQGIADAVDSLNEQVATLPTKEYVDTHQGTPADNTVTTAKIADGAVTYGKLAQNSVISTRIRDEAVTEAKLASGSVTTSKVADKTINEAKLTDALSVKLNERKGIEVFSQQFTVAASATLKVTLTFNQTHTLIPFILPTLYGSTYANVTFHIEGASNTKCEVMIKNNTTSSFTNYFFCVVIDRG